VLNYPLLYLEHLSRRDLQVLGETVPADPAAVSARIREDPSVVDDFLASALLFDRLFGEDRSVQAGVTPFLIFGVLVNRSAAEVRRARYVAEWVEPGKRLPVFDVDPLRDFVDDGVRRFFLIELLSSFTRVASGHWWVRTRRGFRRRRFSELDLARLVEFAEQGPAAVRPALYRRLGDVSLFLSGVFPDHSAARPLDARDREMLARSAGPAGSELAPVVAAAGRGAGEELAFLEDLGGRWYRRAVAEAAARAGPDLSHLEDVADRMPAARRLLNHLSDRHLFRVAPGWLIRPGA
jgi:hypothetical protein